MHYHYSSGLQFLLDQSQQVKDWSSYFRVLPMVANEVLEQTCRGATKISFSSSSLNGSDGGSGSSPVISHSLSNQHGASVECLMAQSQDTNQQIWQLWRWKPPVQSSLQSRDDYFHNPCSTPHSIMNEFKKHLSVSKDLKFRTNDLRRLAEIDFQPLMTFVTQDDYDEHTDSIVRSYFIFKDGVMPLWEDNYNVLGGGWSLIWNHQDIQQHFGLQDNLHNSKKTSKYVWKQVINVLTDPKMVKFIDELCGVGLTIRSNKTYKITVWNRNSDDTITKMMIGQNIKSILNHDGPMFYYSHKSTLKNQYEKKSKESKVRRRINFSNASRQSLFNNNAGEPKFGGPLFANGPRLNQNRSSGFKSQPLNPNPNPNVQQCPMSFQMALTSDRATSNNGTFWSHFQNYQNSLVH